MQYAYNGAAKINPTTYTDPRDPASLADKFKPPSSFDFNRIKIDASIFLSIKTNVWKLSKYASSTPGENLYQ